MPVVAYRARFHTATVLVPLNWLSFDERLSDELIFESTPNKRKELRARRQNVKDNITTINNGWACFFSSLNVKTADSALASSTYQVFKITESLQTEDDHSRSVQHHNEIPSNANDAKSVRITVSYHFLDVLPFDYKQ